MVIKTKRRAREERAKGTIKIKITIVIKMGGNGKGQPGEDARPPPTQSEKKGGASSIPTPPHSGGRRQGTYRCRKVARIVPAQRPEHQLVLHLRKAGLDRPQLNDEQIPTRQQPSSRKAPKSKLQTCAGKDKWREVSQSHDFVVDCRFKPNFKKHFVEQSGKCPVLNQCPGGERNDCNADRCDKETPDLT